LFGTGGTVGVATGSRNRFSLVLRDEAAAATP
jgi:hypothetical protein